MLFLEVVNISKKIVYLRKNKVIKLIRQRKITQNEFAKEIGICKGSLSNALNGKRGVGRRILWGLIKAFPGETMESLTGEAGEKNA